MLLPLLLSLFATVTAAIMSYGVDARWVQHPLGGMGGLGLILLSRRLQWPLVAVSLILCLVLLALVISGKRRVWWLIGLAPVLALFGHRFVTDPANRYAIADEPRFVTAADDARAGRVGGVGDEDYVVGVVFNDQPFAYPYACLYQSPVVVQSDREHRLLLMWSPRANAATALLVARELKARELDIVSEPADGLLLYNARSGQFISAITGATPPTGDKPCEKPGAVEGRLAVAKLPWKQWRSQHPDTRVMLPTTGKYTGPTRPLPPRSADATRVILVGGGFDVPPLAVRSQDISALPLNVSAGNVPVLLFRDGVVGGIGAAGLVVAFDRHVEADLIPRFQANLDRRRKSVALIDSDTNTGWNPAGVAVEGQIKGKKLAHVAVQDEVDWDAAKFWYKNLTIYHPNSTEAAAATQPVEPSSSITRPAVRTRHSTRKSVIGH